ncbi:hypothetical protein LP420_37085 [Massilia sp. B-10]|nr:hypothetical protein LP420_37085 [Massilia sp. B-10]
MRQLAQQLDGAGHLAMARAKHGGHTGASVQAGVGHFQGHLAEKTGALAAAWLGMALSAGSGALADAKWCLCPAVPFLRRGDAGRPG